MKKRKSLFFALCLMVVSLCLFVSCGFGKMESGTDENSSSYEEEILPDDSPSDEPPKEENSTNSGIQFPEVPLP